MKRWIVEATYRLDDISTTCRRFEIEELIELHNEIEHGPDWCALVDIRIRHARSDGTATIESLSAVLN